MTTTISDLDTSGSIRIEVDGPESRGNYNSEFVRAVQTMAAIISGLVSQMPEEQRPQEFSLNFGLKALPTGGFAVSLGTEEANFTLALTWRVDKEHSLLGGEMLQPEIGSGFP